MLNPGDLHVLSFLDMVQGLLQSVLEWKELRKFMI